MGIYAYPPEIEDFVRQMAPLLRDRELAVAVNEKFGTEFTANKMKSYRGNHGIRNYKKQLSHEEYWKYQTRWPAGMFEFIRDNSWGISSEEMANMVNEKFGTNFNKHRMKVFRAKYGIRSGVTGWFQKGRPPATKGKTIEEICKNDPEKLAKVRESWFRKGNRPANEKPVGAIVMTPDGYLIRKKQMEGTQWERWEFLHRAVWEEHNGPIPEGMAVIFRDRDKRNCDINNLMLAQKAEVAVMTKKGYWSEDPDLTETALYTIRLQQTANRKRRKSNGNDLQRGNTGSNCSQS